MFSRIVFFSITVFLNGLNGNVLINDFFSFGPDHNDTDMSNVCSGDLDDGSSPPISLETPFTFYSKRHYSLFVNINGDISFDNAYRGYYGQQTMECHPINEAFNLIMPFWSDHNLRYGGSIFYRQTTDHIILKKAMLIIKSSYPDLTIHTGLNWAFLSTWVNVSVVDDSSRDRTNTYQIALISDGDNSFIILNYNQIEWTKRTDFVENARIGVQNDKGKQYLFPGSCTPDIVDITKMSNVNYPGRFVLKVDGPDVITPNQQKATTSITKAIDNSNYSTTTNSVDHAIFRKHYDSVDHILVGLRKRSVNDCSKLEKRAALYGYCIKYLGLIDALLLELKMTKSVFELNLIDEKIHEIIVALNEIEKDTYLF